VKRLIGTVLALMFSGCASAPSREPLVARVEYLGARDDWAEGGRRLPPIVLSTRVDPSRQHSTFVLPLSYAIVCGAGKSDCRHAIVRTEIKLEVVDADGGEVRMRGALASAIGRSQSVASGTGASRSSVSMMVLESAALIDERTQDTEFDVTLPRGEPYDVAGLAGVVVRLSYHTPDGFGRLSEADLAPTLDGAPRVGAE